MSDLTDVTLAADFHETYERLAPQFDDEARSESALPWDRVPEQIRELMRAVCREIISRHVEPYRAAIRRHRDYRGDDRCHLDDGELYSVLPEGDTRPARDTAVTLENCERFIRCRQQGREYVSPEREVEQLRLELSRHRACRREWLLSSEEAMGILREAGCHPEQVKQLRAALLPFAAAAEKWPGRLLDCRTDQPLPDDAAVGLCVKVSAWRRAAEVIGA